MTEAATFFRNRETDPGRTYQFEIEGLSKQRATVYTCTPVEPESRRLVLKDLNALVSNAGGGLIVTSSDDNGGRFLTVRAVAATGYVPAARYVVLSPGKASYETELDGKAHQLPAGSHAIVPVDEEAAGHLGQLVDRLRWLSPDTEAAVLNILRRPSLDMRLSRIERTVFGKTTDEALAGGMLARLKENLPLATFAMTLLLWILVSINSMLLLGRPSKTNAAEQSTHTETTQTTDAKTDSATGTARSSAQDPLPIVEAAKPLLEQLYAKKENGAWKPFYKTHFSAVPSATPSDDQIGHLFQDPAFLWGLVKLQAMALGADSKDPAFIQKKDDKAAIKRALQSLGNEKILSRSSVFARLTSMLEGKPSAPDFSPVPFTTDKDEVFTDRDLADGLPALAEFLEHAP